MRARGVGSALAFLEWRQAVNNVRGIVRAPRRWAVYLVLLLFAVRFVLVAPSGAGGPMPLPASLADWLPVIVGLALLAPGLAPQPAALFVSPADRTFLVGVRGNARPLVARGLWHRYLRSMRSLLSLVVLLWVFSRSGGVLAAVVWLAPAFALYWVAARLAAGALAVRRAPVTWLSAAGMVAWTAGAVHWSVLRPAPGLAHWPLLSALVRGDAWPLAAAWLALTAVLSALAVLWAVPPRTDDWRQVDRWALVDAVRGGGDRRELFRRQMAERLSRGRGGTRRSHTFRWGGPAAVVEMEALTTWRQVLQPPVMLVLLAAASIGGGVFLAAARHLAVVMWIGAMAYVGMMFTAVQSRLVGSHPIARDPLVIGAPGSSFVLVLAEEAVGWAAGVLFWGGAVLVGIAGGLAWQWAAGALLLVAVGQAVVQSLRILYWTLFPTLFERQVLARLLSMVSAGLVLGVPALPLLALPWWTAVPITCGLALAEAGLLSWWAAGRLQWGHGPVPAVGDER